jgi:hypothetical protein
LFKFFGENNARGALWGQCADSGGGGTGKSFFKCMKVEGLTVEADQYMISFCTLHCLQLTLGVPVKTILLGDGGLLQGKALFKNTAMQLLHGVYNLQDNHEKAEWKTIWKWAAVRSGLEQGNETVPSIPCPIATCWWTVGVAAVFLLKNWDIIAVVVHGVINRLVTSKKENQITSGIQSLMAEPTIKSDVHLIAAYHNHFLFSNFAWLQKGDPENGGTPGFLARHIAVRHFLMHSDLTDGITNWTCLPAFLEAFVKSLDHLTEDAQKQLQKDKVFEFFKMARRILEKHFDLWVNKFLFLAIYGEAETAQVVAQFLLDKEATGFARNGMYDESTMHNRTISLPKFREFLEARTANKPELLTLLHVMSIQQGIVQIADNGGNMWAEANCPNWLTRLRIRYRECYSAVATNSQLAERGVKGSNYCSVAGRLERLESSYGTAHARLVEPINRETRLAHSNQEHRKGNRYVSSGSVNERKRKNGDAFENDELRVRNVVGALHVEHAIKFVTHRSNIISQDCKELEAKVEWERLCREVSETDHQYSVERVKIKTDDFIAKYDKTRAPNVIQRRHGVTVTPFMQKKMPFGKMNRDRDWDNIKKELAHRNLSIEGGWTQCKERLMENEGERQDCSMLSGVVIPWEEDIVI